MDGVIQLNVGGCQYTTSRSTLINPDSMLGAMFSGELDPSVRDAIGAYVIDGDGPIFRHVLNFLRRGKLILPEDFKEWELLASEANFYQVGDLTDAVLMEKLRRVRPEDVTKSAEFEFIEINRSMHLAMLYIGSSETLANLPVFLELLNSGRYSYRDDKLINPIIARRASSRSVVVDVLGVVKQTGIIRCTWSPRHSRESADVEDKRELIFQEILKHGFELKAAVYNSAYPGWTFIRKV